MSPNEQIYFGGDICTMDESFPSPEAVAVRNGNIAAIGTESHCRSALGRAPELIDLKGRTLLPGFIDTHLHPVLMIYFDMNANLGGVTSMDEMKQRLRAAAQSISPGAWLAGLNFDEQFFDEPRIPTRHDLDAACPDIPAIVVRHDGHTIIANTFVINSLGLSASTETPEGGRIDREPDGFPAGPFRENAASIILNAMPLPDQQAVINGAESSFAKLARYGITSIGAVLQTDAEGPAGNLGAFDIPVIQMLLEHIPSGIYGIITAPDMDNVRSAMNTSLHDPAALPTRRIGAVKLYADGTFGSCTSYMNEPFADQCDKRGFMTTGAEELYRRMIAIHAAGLQIAIHAIGDAANRTCVDLYARLLREHPRAGCRHRLEHASQLDQAVISDMARLGIIVSTQPMFIHSEKSWLHRRLGRERTRWTYPLRSLFDAGVMVAGASDAPVESPDVLHAIECCVTREGFETHQCIGAAEALRMYTGNAAYAQFEESIKGIISPGKRADIIILNGNPLRVHPHEIHALEVEKTIIGGRIVYSR